MPTTVIVPTLSVKGLIVILDNIGNWIFVIGLLIAVLMVIIGAGAFLTGGGEPAKMAAGKKILLWAVVGFALTLLAKGVFTVLRSVFGV